MVSSGEVWWGMAGEVSLGKDEQGVVWQARRVRDRSGMARQEWHGMAWSGQAQYGRHGSASHSVVGQGRLGEERRGRFR